MVFLLAWVACRRFFQEDIVIQENVAGFMTNLLVSWLGSLYHFEVAIIDPVSLGWPVCRERKWTVMRHRYKTGAFSMPINT
jgi:hypothetical protein